MTVPPQLLSPISPSAVEASASTEENELKAALIKLMLSVSHA